MYYGGDNYEPRTYEEQYDTIRGMNTYIAKVFGWMFIGLLLTAGVGYLIAGNLTLVAAIVTNPILFFGLLIAEVVMVMVLSARITKLSYGAAIALFLAYAAINGVTFSIILLAYTSGTIATAFSTTAITFGIMCVYGYFTRADLTRFRTILFMGLIGVLVLSVVNLFLASSSVDWIISVVSLFVFLGLTAYDMQRLKAFYFGTEGNSVLRSNLGIIGALRLYLDFINLFLTMLRFMGGRRR
ncbi:MAG TPA: Bax inhibitor-1/YccA family protein [Thermoclostridium sp.]|nr:Bax inhibitor-1/YccA family protein [Clostridiaceae bacterium]HOQ76015.1 Bax inhibitor-1/YccA family protein [Thermoclostridium sp.]HPU45700.1 Bax inhibitor-1/YccA family protein [Thermoclostridium sp.]